MKYFNLTSPYVHVSVGFATLTLCLGLLFWGQPNSRSEMVAEASPQFEWPVVVHDEAELNTSPCYTARLDPAVPGGTARRTALGQSLVVENAAFMAQLETFLVNRLTGEAWKRNRKCIEGSFVVNFSVLADGSLGNTMMLHHERGGGAYVGTDIFMILQDLDREGIRWHDGTLGKGEIILPVRFRIG